MVCKVRTIFDIKPIYCHFVAARNPKARRKSLFYFYLHTNESLHRMVIVMHLQATNRTESMLRITTEKKRGKIFLSVEGRLAGPWVGGTEQGWRGVRRGGAPRE